jgi:LysR family transcriptional activator of nhaA
MEWLNYHHLLYFWVVAKEGSIVKASEQLRLAPPTISGQIRMLEDALGVKLFARSGRKLVLTDVGRVVYRYAEEIFTIGKELLDTLGGRPVSRPLRFEVGIADVVPKLVARKLLEPCTKLPQQVQLICHEDKPHRLLAELAIHELDIVISDGPVDPGIKIRAYNHLLVECGVLIFGTPSLAKKYRKGFPKSLNEAPFLLPGEGTAMRRSLNEWLQKQRVVPMVVAEFADSALLKVFGQRGAGLFPAPEIIGKEVQRQYGVQQVGTARGIREKFYAISAERKLVHPAVVAISTSARKNVLR